MPQIESVNVSAACPSTPRTGQNTTVYASYGYIISNDSSDSISLTLNGTLSDSAGVMRAEFTRSITVPPGGRARDSFNEFGIGKYDEPGWVTVTASFVITGVLSDSTNSSCTFRVIPDQGPEIEFLGVDPSMKTYAINSDVKEENVSM
jgi:hypothetical protein